MEKRFLPAGISFGVVCRGAGRIYVQLRSRLSEPVHSWRVFALTNINVAPPAYVTKTKSGMDVLVLAVIMPKQYVTVEALDAEGKVLGTVSHVIRHGAVKAKSPANSYLHREVVEEMRQLSQRRPEDRTWIGDFDIIHDLGENLLQATLVIEDDTDAVSRAQMEISFIGDNGNYIPAERVKVVGDVVRRRSGSTSDYVRTVRVSARIPGWLAGMSVWAHFVDGSYEDCIATVEPHVMRDMRIEGLSHILPAEASDNYHDWFMTNRSGKVALDAQRKEQEGFAIRPLFSIVVPLYHTPIEFLREAVGSVLEQSYPNLELVLVNSTPEDDDLREEVQRIASGDERVKVVTLDGNKGITENTNYGIEAATGDFVCFMDHDDVIERDLFYWYAKGVNEYPTTDLMYCDEDLLVEGRYIHPVFKPDWSVLFLESNNYVCHLLTVRRSILDKIPTPTRELDGAQDHSMTLAVGEHARNVYHARRVLYHWRSHPLSTAQNPDAKPESLGAGQLGIQRHYDRIGFDARCIPSSTWIHTYNTRPTIAEWPSISFVVWGDERPMGWSPSVLGKVDAPCEVLEVERADGQTWSQAVSARVAEATGDVVVIIAREAAPVTPTWLERLVAYALREDVGVAAPRLLYTDHLIASIGVTCSDASGLQHMGGFISREAGNGHGYTRMQHDVTAVDPRCLVTQRALLEKMGGWNDSYRMRCACVDYCMRLRSAHKSVGVFPAADVEVMVEPRVLDAQHDRHASAERKDYAALISAWPRLAEYDPFYSSMFLPDGHFGFEGGWKWSMPLMPVERLRYKFRY